MPVSDSDSKDKSEGELMFSKIKKNWKKDKLLRSWSPHLSDILCFVFPDTSEDKSDEKESEEGQMGSFY